MKSTHLSEEQIQAMVFEKKTDGAAAVHLQACKYCSDRLKVYELIFDRLEDEPIPAFNFRIDNPVPAAKKIKTKGSPIPFFVFPSLAFILSVFGLLGYLSAFYKSTILVNGLIVATAAVCFCGLLWDLVRRNQQKLNALEDQILQH